MTKHQRSNRELKKPAKLTPKEKKAAKRDKKHSDTLSSPIGNLR